MSFADIFAAGIPFAVVGIGIQVGKLIAFQFIDSLFQNLLVCFIAKIGNETALLGSQHVTGTTDIQVLHGDMDTATQLREVLDGLQTPACLLCQ